jgi:uncharacterized membrane protein
VKNQLRNRRIFLAIMIIVALLLLGFFVAAIACGGFTFEKC